MNIRPFVHRDISSAADLLTTRLRRENVDESVYRGPGLETGIDRLWKRPFTSGVLAIENGRPRAYLLGVPRFDQLIGRSVWIYSAGYGYTDAFDADLFKELYAEASREWLSLGCFDHFVMVPAADRTLLEVWNDLGFARQQVYGLRELSEADMQIGTDPLEMVIRRGTMSDGEEIANFANLTANELAASPAYAPHPREFLVDRPQSYAEAAVDETVMVWLAEQAGRMLGLQIYYPSTPEPEDIHVPGQCVELAVGVTLPGVRRQGVTRRIAAHAFADLYQRDFRYLMSDWRSATLSASRTWPRLGFRPHYYRLYRRIDERITWARP